MFLYPQLPHPTCVSLFNTLRNLPVEEAAQRASYTHSTAVFTATGGNRVGDDKLATLRDLVVRLARDRGYPDPGDEKARLAFDSAVAGGLHSEMQIPPGEASKPGIWEFITCVLLPDVVRWRFPGFTGSTTADRFFAGRRNVFQRLWWRAHLLSQDSAEDPYWALKMLGEDEQVQLMERPTLAAVRPLTKIVASEFLAAAQRHPDITPRRILLREAQKRLLRLSALVAFGAVESKELEQAVRQIFNEVAESVA